MPDVRLLRSLLVSCGLVVSLAAYAPKPETEDAALHDDAGPLDARAVSDVADSVDVPETFDAPDAPDAFVPPRATRSRDDSDDNESGLVTASRLARWLDDWEGTPRASRSPPIASSIAADRERRSQHASVSDRPEAIASIHSAARAVRVSSFASSSSRR